MTTTPEIVHSMNELITAVEMRILKLGQDIANAHLGKSEMTNRMNHLKRCLGQLRAARTSLLGATYNSTFLQEGETLVADKGEQKND